jgi:hypothetical protein
MERMVAILMTSAFLWTCDASGGDPPCPPIMDISPWDAFGQAFVSPGTGSVDELTVRIVEYDCDPGPFPNIDIEIDVTGCSGLCINPGDDGLTGVTDEASTAVLNPQVGGCADCSVVVRGNGVTLAVYERVVSTDWDGTEADGVVDARDFAFFATAFRVTQAPCADYNGDDVVGATDFAVFAEAFKSADANDGGCR